MPRRSKIGRDEHYVLDLCDQTIGHVGKRQHRFPFLLGDPGRNGVRRQLPVDAFYEPLNLVIEYRELQHFEPVEWWDKRPTISSKPRGQQRVDYDNRRVEALHDHDINVLVLTYHMFPYRQTKTKRLVRRPESDLAVVRRELQPHLA